MLGSHLLLIYIKRQKQSSLNSQAIAAIIQSQSEYLIQTPQTQMLYFTICLFGLKFSLYLCVCICAISMSHMCRYLQKSEGVRSCGAGIIHGHGLPGGFWEPGFGPLEEQTLFLTFELSLHPHFFFIFNKKTVSHVA